MSAVELDERRELAHSLAASTQRRLADAHVAVVFGGTSSERDVSLATGREVLAALEVRDERGPARTTAVEIDARGEWRFGERGVDAARALGELAAADVCFLALHGGLGENGTLQGWLELGGAVFTGSSAQASALCMDKLALRGLALQSGVRVARAAHVPRAERGSVRARLEHSDLSHFDGWVVKPRCGGSSVATFVLDDAGGLEAAIEAVLATGDDALIEERVRGVELSAGVLGNRGRALVSLPPVEIRPRGAAFFDYREKYSSEGATEHCPPIGVDAAAVRRVEELARRAHAVAGCDGYSRTDFIVPDDGEPVLLEVNTLPGLTSRSLLPQEAQAIGIDYRTLCLLLAASALDRAQTP